MEFYPTTTDQLPAPLKLYKSLIAAALLTAAQQDVAVVSMEWCAHWHVGMVMDQAVQMQAPQLLKMKNMMKMISYLSFEHLKKQIWVQKGFWG